MDASDKSVKDLMHLSPRAAFSRPRTGVGCPTGRRVAEPLDRAVVTAADGVVHRVGPHQREPDRPAARGREMTCTTAPWWACFPHHHRSAPPRAGTAAGSLWMTAPSGSRWAGPAAFALLGAVVGPGHTRGPSTNPDRTGTGCPNRPGSRAHVPGTGLRPVLALEPGQGLLGGPPDVQHTAAYDTARRARPLGQLLSAARSFLPEPLRLYDAGTPDTTGRPRPLPTEKGAVEAGRRDRDRRT